MSTVRWALLGIAVSISKLLFELKPSPTLFKIPTMAERLRFSLQVLVADDSKYARRATVLEFGLWRFCCMESRLLASSEYYR